MSKKTRAAAKAKKQLTHNQRRKQEYEALAGRKESRSAKRVRLQKKKLKSVLKGAHDHCGNLACRKCFKELNSYLDARDMVTGI